jgi:hypothetical protein
MGGFFSNNKPLSDIKNLDSNDEYINDLVKKHNIGKMSNNFLST